MVPLLKKGQLYSCRLKKKEPKQQQRGKKQVGTFPEHDTFTAYRTIMFFFPVLKARCELFEFLAHISLFVRKTLFLSNELIKVELPP